MSSHSNSNVIHLDLASQKLLVKPDEPIPEFYPPPRAVMVTPIYNDADAYTQQPLSAGGGERGFRGHRDGGRRYYDDTYGDYGRGRPYREREQGRGGSSSPYSVADEMEDRKRSRVPGTEPPLLPPPDISHYPGGSAAGSAGYGRTHGHGHGRSHSQSYGRYDRDYRRYERPYHQSNKLRKGRSRDGYERRGRSGYRADDYPPSSDYDSDDYYPDDRYPDDDSYYSYTGGGGRGGYLKRSRPAGTEPPKLPPPDISGYPGGGGHHGVGGGGRVQGVPGVHEGAGPAPGAGSSGSAGHGYAGSQQHPSSQQGHGPSYHGGQPYPTSQQGHLSGHAGSQFSQQHPAHDKKPGLIGRIFSGSNRAVQYPQSGPHPGQFVASHKPSAVPGRPAPMHMPSSYSAGSNPSSAPPHMHEGHGTVAVDHPKTHLSPITQAFLRIATKKGYGDEITRYINQLPPNPQFCWSKCTGAKKAVLIGINYVGMKDELRGCANDARNMRDFLVNVWHFNPANIVLITDENEHRTPLRPTRREMFNAMAWLVHDAKPNDSLFFHYSGHGGQSKDASGREDDGMDEVIYPLDYDDAGDIIDDELHSALVVPLQAGVRLTAVFDSCHSGGLLDLPYLHSAHGRLRSMRHVSKRAQQRGCADSADVLCIAACKSDETSADTHEGNVAVGAMSYALIQALKNKPDQTYQELLTHLREILIPKYDQKAQMSGTHPMDLERQFVL